MNRLLGGVAFMLVISMNALQAQQASPTPSNASAGREWYLSWGYNANAYARSDIHFEQSPLGNDFTLHSVEAHDDKGWTTIFHHAPTVPQDDFRLGHFFSDKWGVELALDHIKWVVVQGQDVRLTGKLGGLAADKTVTLTPTVLRYRLNNGANPIFINAIRRFRLVREPGHTGSVSFLAKAGAGFAVPHTENWVFGQPNEPGFQWFHGWDLDADVAVRVNVFKRIYVEVEDKLIYAGYHGVNIDQGKANHNVKDNEIIVNFGFGLPFGHG